MKDKTREQPLKGLQCQQSEHLSQQSSRAGAIPPCESDSKKTGRWTMDEHFRFIEALQQFGKEWKRVQQHVGSRSSTQARSHAQKFFVKLDKRGQRLDDFLSQIDLEGVRQRMMEAGSDQDYEDPDNYNLAPVKKPSLPETQPTLTSVLPNVSIIRPQEVANKSQSQIDINEKALIPTTPITKQPQIADGVSQSSPMLSKRLNGDRNPDKNQLAGIDLGMNVKNMRLVQGRSSSKSFHQVSSLKRQKTEVPVQYQAVSTEFNIKLGGNGPRQPNLISPNLQSKKLNQDKSAPYKLAEGLSMLGNLDSGNDLQVQLQQQPATCRPTSSANHRLIDNWEQQLPTQYLQEQPPSSQPQQPFQQQVPVPQQQLEMSTLKPGVIAQPQLQMPSQIISMTPRLKYSEHRSPMIATTTQRLESKKAASLIELDEPFDFIIERNNKHDLSSGMEQHQNDDEDDHYNQLPNSSGINDGVFNFNAGGVDREQAPPLPINMQQFQPGSYINQHFAPNTDFPQKQMHRDSAFEPGLSKSYNHMSMPVQNLLFQNLAAAPQPAYLQQQLLMQQDYLRRGSFEQDDAIEITPQGYNNQYNRKQASPLHFNEVRLRGQAHSSVEPMNNNNDLYQNSDI